MNSDITVADPRNAIKVTAENAYNTTIIIDKHRAFLQRLFPTKLQQALNKSELIQARTELEFREKALKIAKESQLQSIQEIFNDFLIKGKSDIRGDRVVFFARKLQELEAEISGINDSFSAFIQEQQAKLDKISVPLLKQHAEKRIEKSMERFFDTVDKLMADFQNILNEEVKA
jgi:hemoglobin-like flavoprotein